VSKDITAASGMDCFTQLTEAYLSDKSSEYTDALAIEGLKAIKASLIRSYSDGEDIDAEPACHSLLLPREFAWQMQDLVSYMDLLLQ